MSALSWLSKKVSEVSQKKSPKKVSQKKCSTKFQQQIPKKVHLCKQYYLPVSWVTSLTGQAPVNRMSLRKQTDGRVFKKEEFIELDGMRKLLFAGNPSDSDPGYEVPQLKAKWNEVLGSSKFQVPSWNLCHVHYKLKFCLILYVDIWLSQL